MYKILHYPDPKLKTVAKPVTDFQDPDVQEMIDRMLETLEKTDDCGGLAATQLDIPNPRRITVVDWEGQPMCLVNPEIIATEGEVQEPEACMSVYPGYVAGKVKRPTKTTVNAYDRNGNEFTLTGEDYYAKLLQHEIDHLNGKVYLDRLSNLKRSRLEEKIRKVIKFLSKKQSGSE